jgi:hypothetical protein
MAVSSFVHVDASSSFVVIHISFISIPVLSGWVSNLSCDVESFIHLD